MGWGGSRPGAGRKPLPEGDRKDRKRLPPSARTTKAQPSANVRQQLALDFGSLAAASRARSKRRIDRPELNPFQLPVFPPQAMPPEGSKLRMAMDNAPALDWAGTQWAGGYLSDVAAEGLTFLGYNYLAELMQRPEYRTPIETIASEMTRKWIKFTSAGTTDPKKDPGSESIESTGEVDQEGQARDKGPPPQIGKPQAEKKPPTDKQDNATTERIKELVDFLDDLQVRDKFKKLAEGDGSFGRIHLYLDSGAGPEEDMTPIAEPYTRKFLRGKVGRKWLKRLQVIEPIWTYPTTYNATNPTAIDWYDPQVWYVMGKQIHKSRIPVMIGRPVPDLLKPSYAFGGLALSQMMKPYVDIWLTTRQSIGDLIHAFSVMVLSTDLQTILAPGGNGAAGLFARADCFNALRDNAGLFLVNKSTEEFSNVSAPLSGLHELQSQSQEHMLSVTRIPAVKAFGIQPQGLNASSEGEMRAFNDTIKAAQNSMFKPTLDYVIDLAQITLWGKKDPDIVYDFESLVEMTEEEKGKIKKAKAETGQIHIDTGVIDPAEERKRIIDDPESDYQGLDPDDVPEPPADPNAGDDDEPGFDPGKKPPGGADSVIPFDEAEDAEFNEEDHPRAPDGKFGSGGGGSQGSGGKTNHGAPQAGKTASGGKQSLRMPQFGLTPKPTASHQNEPDDGSEYFKKNWHKSNTVGGHNQPTPEQVAAYTAAYENQGKEEPKALSSFEATMAKPALKPGDLKRVGKQLGSNPGGVFEDKEGKRYYVKDSHTPDHAKSELLAANLYALAGSPTLKYRAVEGGGKVATEWQSPSERDASKFTPEQKAEAQENFATHAWLANWDAAGLNYDNQNIVDGKATTVDVGGSLAYRAQGGPKGAAWGDKVGEWDTLRDAKINPQNANMFGSMTPEQLKASAEKVTKIPNAAIVEAVKANGMGPDMAKRLIARKRDIASKVGLQAADQALDHAHQAAVRAIASLQAQDRLFDNPDLDTAYWIASTSPEARRRRDEVQVVVVDPHSITRGGGGGPSPEPDDDQDAGIGEDETDAHGHEHAGPGPGGGQFVSQGGGGSSEGEEPKKPEIEKEKKTAFGGLWKAPKAGESESVNFNANVAGVLAKPANAGTSYRQMLAFMIKNVAKHGAGEMYLKPLKEHLLAAWQKAGEKLYAAGDMEGAKKIHAKLEQMEKEHGIKAPPPTGASPPPAPKVEEAKAKIKAAVEETVAKMPPPTQAELTKAKKATTLPASMFHAGLADSVAKFNAKYANKSLTDPKDLAEKISTYKTLKAASDALNAASQAEQQAAAKAAQEKAQAAAKKAAEELAAKEKAELDEIMSDPDSAAAYTEMEHVTHGQGFTEDYIKKATKAFQDSSYNNVKMSGVEKGAISAYTGSHYRAINASLREGVMTKDQYAFTKTLNSALTKLPPYKGTVHRKADLTPQQASLYKPGMIVEERAFTSSSKSSHVWSGSYQYEIESLTGRDVQPISSHKSEQEILFRSGSRFEVVSVSGTKIKMKEVPIV